MTEKPETPETSKPEEAVKTPEIPKIDGLTSEVVEVGPCKIEVTIKVPAKAVEEEKAKAFDELVPNATIHGFRVGHAPRKLVERHFEEAVLEDTKRSLVARSWELVKQEKEIRPIGEPDLKDEDVQYEKETGISYKVATEVVPKFEVKDYFGLELSKPPTEVTEEDLARALDSMRRRNAVLEPVEGGTTKQDDVPVVDCDIKVEGAVIQSVSDQEFSLGPDNWLRGLDAEIWKDLLGKKAGESVSKTVKLPDTYQKEEFRGKDADVAVTIKDIKRPRLPELSDEFAKDMLFGSLEELKTEMRKRLSETKEQAARADLARQVEEKLLASADFKLPEELVKRLAERNVNRARLNLAYQGVSRDEIAAATEEIVKGSLIKAVHDVRMEFVFGQLAEKEKVTVSDAEVENRINALAYQRGMRPARFREELRREGLIEQVRAEIMDEKTMDKLISKAKIKTEDRSSKVAE